MDHLYVCKKHSAKIGALVNTAAAPPVLSTPAVTNAPPSTATAQKFDAQLANLQPIKRKTIKRVAAADPEVNFGTLHMNTLKRYKRHYKLVEETTNKQELIDVSAACLRACCIGGLSCAGGPEVLGKAGGWKMEVHKRTNKGNGCVDVLPSYTRTTLLELLLIFLPR